MWEIIETVQDFIGLTKTPKKILVVEFWAEWCGPCLSIQSDEEEFSKRLETEVLFKRIDIDKKKTEVIVEKFRVLCAPTFLIFKDGKLIGTVIGANLKKVQRALKKVFSSNE